MAEQKKLQRKRKGPALKAGFFTSKGGSGKTMLSLNVAAKLAAEGYNVLLVDHDNEGSLNDFFATRKTLEFANIQNLDFVYHPKADLHTRLADEDTLAKYDFILVDGAPGADSAHLRSEVASVDHIFIPIQPAMSELKRARSLIALTREAQNAGHNVKAYFTPSRVVEGTRIAKGFLEALDNEGIPRLKTGTWNRVAYAESMSNYQTLLEWEPRGKASQEIENITKAIFNLMTKKG